MSLTREIEGEERVDAAKLAPITIKLSRTELEIRAGAAEVRDRSEATSISRFAAMLLERSPEFRASLNNPLEQRLLIKRAYMKKDKQKGRLI